MKYVAGFLMDRAGQVLLVRKEKPQWQEGKLNGIGGKIEEDDASPLEAMIREWLEETGEPRNDWREFCAITGPGYEVHFFASQCDFLLQDKWKFGKRDTNDVGEKLEIHYAKYIGALKCIENLNWLLPMAFSDPFLPKAKVTNDR